MKGIETLSKNDKSSRKCHGSNIMTEGECLFVCIGNICPYYLLIGRARSWQAGKHVHQPA